MFLKQIVYSCDGFGALKMDCVFCKIVNGTVPKFTIFEDEYTLAFLDIANDVDGHTVVIPKAHVAGILDCDSITWMRLMNTVKLVSLHYVDNCGYQGVNLLNASGEAAQQSVPHLHMHVIPRKKDDGVDAWPAFTGAREPMEAMQAKLAYKG